MKVCRSSVVALLAMAAMVPHPLFACAACFGQSDSAMAAGMNWGILSLLVMIVMMLGGVAAFFVFLARRAATVARSDLVPPGQAEGSWSPDSNDTNVVETSTLSYRSNLRQASTLAHPPHLCEPVQAGGRAASVRKRA
jgi:hypothetical protein